MAAIHPVDDAFDAVAFHCQQQQQLEHQNRCSDGTGLGTHMFNKLASEGHTEVDVQELAGHPSKKLGGGGDDTAKRPGVQPEQPYALAASGKSPGTSWAAVLDLHPDAPATRAAAAGGRRPYWNFLCVLAAVLTGFTAPFAMAFDGSDDFDSHTWAMLDYWLVAVFSADILLTFFTQSDDQDSGTPVTSLPHIALNYARGTLVLDLLVTLPWDKVVLAGLAREAGSSKPALLVGLLRLLALGRLHRVASFVAMIEYRMLLPQAALILLRNNLYVLCSCHVAGMVFYLVARLEHFRSDSWVGRNYQRFEGIPVLGRYIYSLYFAMAAFTGLGDNDFYIASVPEAVVMLVYLLFNLLLGAYILGTVTMLLTKGDKRMKLFRDRRLMTAMEAHVELHFQSEQASDEQVLAIFPQTIRRRVLRHLYIKPIKECHLFAGCKPKYLDAVLAAGRVELFMPQEQIIADGDIVNEIWVLLEGEVEVCRGGAAPAHLRFGYKQASSTHDGMTKALMSRNKSKSKPGRQQEQQGNAQGKGGGTSDQGQSPSMLHSFARQSNNRVSIDNVPRDSSLLRTSSMNGSECGSEYGSMGIEGSGHQGQSCRAGTAEASSGTGSPYTELAPGAAFGEISFFTELPSQESVWSSSVIKVLVLNRTAYQELLTAFPQQTRKVLQNLEVHNDELVTNTLLSSLTASKNMSEEVAQALHLLAIRDVGPSDLTAGVLMEMHGLLEAHQRPMLDNMGKVKDALAKCVCKVDQEIVYDFLNNCSGGDEAAVRAALSGGMSPNAADYDKRTGLMLACHEGHTGLVRMLLEAGADPQLKDSFGGVSGSMHSSYQARRVAAGTWEETAMWECVKNSRDGIIEILLEFGGSLGMEGFLVSSHLSQGVCEGDMVQVSRMIKAGANLNVPDYSGMTPLHVAVLSGNLRAVQLLVNEGAAKVDYKDTLGFTPYEEAVRLRNQPIADFLKAITEKAISDAADLARNMDFLNFCSAGNESMVRQMLKAGQDPDTADYDVRTGLMLACHEGHEVRGLALSCHYAVLLLLELCRWEAVLNKRHAIIGLMLEFGGGLGMQGVALSATMSRLIREQDLPVLHSLLRAKADPDTEDYVCQAPLHVAALLGNLQAVRLLVEDANACVDPVDLHGHTPLDCARTRSHWQVVEYLEPLTQAAAQVRQQQQQQEKHRLRQRRQRRQLQQQGKDSSRRGMGGGPGKGPAALVLGRRTSIVVPAPGHGGANVAAVLRLRRGHTAGVGGMESEGGPAELTPPRPLSPLRLAAPQPPEALSPQPPEAQQPRPPAPAATRGH
ncbi:ankyrin repeat-containing domain protein [Haematococcus lacustris]